MRYQDYPPQEPPSAAATGYRDACIAGSFGVPFCEFSFGSDPHQSVAVYSAERPDGALFAFMHGGGWTGGYKENMGFMAPAFTSHGITFASVGYRLAPEHQFSPGLEDCAMAVKALRDRAAEYGYDPEKIFIGGHSSGGHYAALLAVRRDWQEGLQLSVDVIKGCLPISGVYRLGEGSGLSMRPRFLGPADDAVDWAASPVQRIRGTPPPFLMACGENDFPHLRAQATEMERALREAGGTVSSIMLPGCDHFTASLEGGNPDGQWVSRAIDFIVLLSGRDRS